MDSEHLVLGFLVCEKEKDRHCVCMCGRTMNNVGLKGKKFPVCVPVCVMVLKNVG